MTNGSEHAFPHMAIDGAKIKLEGGLSKREYFAALAMQGFCTNDPNKGRMICDYESVTVLAVEYADDLIEELEKKE